MNSYVSLLCLSALLVTFTLPSPCRAAPSKDFCKFLESAIAAGASESRTDIMEFSIALQELKPGNAISARLETILI